MSLLHTETQELAEGNVVVGRPYADLVGRARGGDAEARELLYAQAVGIVTATARRRARQAQDVDDIVQETFTRAFADLDRLRTPEAFPGWAARIAGNVAADLHRHEGRERPVAIPADAILDRNADPAAVSQARDQSSRTIEGLRDLPARDREALVLRDAYALEVAEIARRLQLTRGATRSLLTRARRRAAVALSGALVWLPAAAALRARRWLDRSRALTPLPMTATAAVLTLATVPLVDAVLHDVPAEGAVGAAPTEAAATLTAAEWLLAAESTASPATPSVTEADRAGTDDTGDGDGHELSAGVDGVATAGTISRRRAKDRDVGLIVQDADGNTVLDIGGNVPNELAGPLRDAGLLGHEVVVQLGGEDGVTVRDDGRAEEDREDGR